MTISKCHHYNTDNKYCLLKSVHVNDYQIENYCVSENNTLRCSEYNNDKSEETELNKNVIKRTEEPKNQSRISSSQPSPSPSNRDFFKF